MPDTSIVERIAESLRRAHSLTTMATIHSDDYWRGQASAAIEAMREPTQEMMQAMHEAMFADPFDGTNEPMLGAGFEAAIDAALSTEEK